MRHKGNKHSKQQQGIGNSAPVEIVLLVKG